jgi:hypothetical protein
MAESLFKGTPATQLRKDKPSVTELNLPRQSKNNDLSVD